MRPSRSANCRDSECYDSSVTSWDDQKIQDHGVEGNFCYFTTKRENSHLFNQSWPSVKYLVLVRNDSDLTQRTFYPCAWKKSIEICHRPKPPIFWLYLSEDSSCRVSVWVLSSKTPPSSPESYEQVNSLHTLRSPSSWHQSNQHVTCTW